MPHQVVRWTTTLWQIVGSVNIRAKILGIVLGLVVLMGVAATIEVRTLLNHTLTVQTHERSIAIARDVAARSTDLVLMRDYYGLFRLLRDTQENNPDVRYAFISLIQRARLSRTPLAAAFRSVCAMPTR
ncbi:hypothetical protein [Chloroflexus sp.]|uniref:hypothetical protein n=1 Tax=Chloroflexus sp. TaxID=1904827 RepID=UPI00404B7792